MSIGTAGMIGLGVAGAAAGGIAGAIGSNQSQSYGVQTGPMSQLGNFGSQASEDSFRQYVRMMNAANPYTMNANAGLAQMLQQYAQSGGLPNQGQMGMANLYAQNIFAPQQAALNNSYTQAQIDTARQAANLGRSTNDPILNAKLAQYQGQQQAVLSGQQGAFAAQTAMSLPQQQLAYQRALSDQATANQTGILGLGQGLLQNAQQYQLATATRNQSAQSGGGLAGALGGIFGGVSSGLNLGQSINNFQKQSQIGGFDFSNLGAQGGYSGGPNLWGNPSAPPGPSLWGGGGGGAPSFGFGAWANPTQTYSLGRN